jgi:hypothetical protein
MDWNIRLQLKKKNGGSSTSPAAPLDSRHLVVLEPMVCDSVVMSLRNVKLFSYSHGKELSSTGLGGTNLGVACRFADSTIDASE